MPIALDHGDRFLWLAGAGLLIAVLVAYVLFFLGALASILGSRQSGGMKLVWIVFAFCAPFLGPLLWFLVGRPGSGRDIR
jgi:hypothetical protein